MDESSLEFETLAAQAGLKMRVGDTISTAPAIDASTTFTYDSVADVHEALASEGRGYAYARNANPTVAALERALAGLEAAEEVVAFASGMAAIHAVLLGVGVESGDVVLAAGDLYGITRSLLLQLANFDVEAHFVDVNNLEELENALAMHRPRAVLFESISNPLLRVSDVEAVAALVSRHQAVTIVDNTFATPYLLRPLDVGVDVVVHSASKYLAGHGDVIAGIAATRRSYAKRIRDMRTVSGGVLSPFEAWLTLRGLRTLPVRMERHVENALRIAEWLADQPWINRVYYPGLAGHPHHELARRQFRAKFGGVVAFELKAAGDATLEFIDALTLITPGTSLGDVESLVLYPRLSSHRTLLPDELRQAGIGESLVRLSVGLESVGDLRADLRQAALRAGIAAEAHPAEQAPTR